MSSTVPPPPSTRLDARKRWLLLGAWLFAATFVACADLLARRQLAGDLKSFYFAARVADRGGDIYAPAELAREAARAGTGGVYPYLYPPVVAYVLAPLSRWAPASMQAVWSVTCLLAAASAITIALAISAPRATDEERRPGLDALLLGALVLWVLPLRNNIDLGQINPVVVCLLTIAVAAFLTGRDLACGACLALATLIKITPAIFVLLLLARRRRRALAAWAVTLGATVIVTLPMGALGAWGAFFGALPSFSHGSQIPGLFGPEAIFNFSYAGFFSRLAPAHPAAVKILAMGAALLSAAPAAACALRASEETERLAVALFFPAMLLASPLLYVHHVLYLAPALVIWLGHEAVRRRPALAAALLGASVVASTDLPLIYPRVGLFAALGPLATSLNLVAVIAVYGLGVKLYVEESRASSVRSPSAPEAAST